MTKADEKVSEPSEEPPEDAWVPRSAPLVLDGNADSRIKSELAGDKSKETDDKPSDRDLSSLAPSGEGDLESGEGAELKRTTSRVIPRTHRRGLFAQLVIGIPEIDDPVQYSRGKKNFIVFIIACAAIAAPMGHYLLSMSLTLGPPSIFPHFLTSSKVSTLIQTLST